MPTASRPCWKSRIVRSPRPGPTSAELTSFRSVTVVGPGLAFTDAYATAVFVMGLDGLAWIDAKDGYAALAITADDRVVWTPKMEQYLVR